MNTPIDVSGIRNGDEKAFVGLYHQLNGRVYNYFLKKTQDAESAKDLTQLCFIRIYQYRASLSLEHAIEKQVYIIARSVLLNALRQEGRQRSRETKYAKSTATVEEAIGFSFYETKDYLDKLTGKLPPVRQKVILLKTVKGLSNKEIAEELSISVKTVENHITKANQHLRLLSADLLLLAILFSTTN